MNIRMQIKPIIFTLLLTVMVTGCSNIYINQNKSTDNELSSERIHELRKEYPLSEGSPEFVELIDLTFKDVLEYTDSVIVAEVIQQMPNFSVELLTEPGTPEWSLAEKDKSAGLDPYKPVFTSFQVKVDEVVGGEAVENTINLIYNSDFNKIEPYLKPGMKIVAAIKKGVGPEQVGSYSFTRYGTYYVVDGDYVLSAFEGETDEMKSFSSKTNGKSLDNLKSEIKELFR